MRLIVKKGRFSVLVFMVVAVTVILNGCGGSVKQATEEQLAFIDKTMDHLDSATSFAMTGTVAIDVDAGGQIITVRSTIDGELERIDNHTRMRMIIISEVTSSPEDRQELTITGYLQDGIVYTMIDEGKWYYSEAEKCPSEISPLPSTNLSQFIPNVLFAFIVHAEEISVKEEDAATIEFEFKMPGDYFSDMAIRRAERQFGKNYDEFTQEEWEAAQKIQLYSLKNTDTTYTLKISKPDGTLLGLGIDMNYEVDSPSGKIESSYSMLIDFYDYGKIFDIQLPDDIENAEYLDPYSTIEPG